MAIPVYLQSFKSSGIYRVVFDKSVITSSEAQTLRLVVGYSEKGPFNTPVYIRNTAEFNQMFGGISRKLEKRGVFFHRLCLQMLSAGPIICLNLKKFNNETVDGATISTDFNLNYDPIDTVKINIEDIFDTTRFWELDENQLNNLHTADGSLMDSYINICAKDIKANSGTFFIRKANGTKVSNYNITVNSWYKDGVDEMPEFLEGYENNLMSDFFAEIYVFKGKFTAKQVLASETLKNYFTVSTADGIDDEGNQVLKLREYVVNAFGEKVDTLDALYADETSGALGHWVGTLIPDFKNKQGIYQSLNILFNSDSDTHNMMMSFNTDLLEEFGGKEIDLSGRNFISSGEDPKNNGLTIDDIYSGKATTRLLGNADARVIADKITFETTAYNNDTPMVRYDTPSKTKLTGTFYVSNISGVNDDNEHLTADDKTLIADSNGDYQVDLTHIEETDDGTPKKVSITLDNKYKVINYLARMGMVVTEYYTDQQEVSEINETLKESDYRVALGDPKAVKAVSKYGTYYKGDEPFSLNDSTENILNGPQKVITGISRLEFGAEDTYTDVDENARFTVVDVDLKANVETLNKDDKGNDITGVYTPSVTFIEATGEISETENNHNWFINEELSVKGATGVIALQCKNIADKSLLSILNLGDALLAKDGEIDKDNDGIKNDEDGYCDVAYVQDMGTEYNENGEFQFYYVACSAAPLTYGDKNNMLVRIDSALNKEIGKMIPRYLEGYIYKNDRPAGSGMLAKVNWQESLLSVLTDYKGLRTALLNKAEIEFRYLIDTFESFPVTDLKKELASLCKEKQNAFCIANFPAIKTFTKCPYTSFTDAKGVFDMKYIINGYNSKKTSINKFSIPAEADGASFIAFYTPLKFSDGYIDTIVPSAGLVSNLFINKYVSRHPYDIIAGPNYGSISAPGLIGPDYKFAQEELHLLEPYGVNAMVYRPNFGTFINSNQTAKQTPVSALSKVHVRELVIHLQDEIEQVLQSYQWEFNNQTTRNAILDRANYICEIIKSNGGILAYRNIMDETNNTDEIIDNEMAILTTHIEPGRGMGKMVHELHIYGTGKMSATIAD